MVEKLFSPKCFRCEFIRCINFFQRIKESAGGELYVLSITFSKRFPPCIVGNCIEVLCRITYKLVHTPEVQYSPITYVLPQVIRDLKCSLFLAFSGHYRNAFQVLRPTIENFLVGLYFYFLGNPNDFRKWTEGKYKIPETLYFEIVPKSKIRKEKLDYSFILEFLVKRHILKSRWKGWIEKNIFSILNKFLHPYFPEFEWSSECLSCPATTKFNEKELKEWLEMFQRIFWFIMISIFEIFGFENFERDQYVRESLESLVLLPEIIPNLIKSKKYEMLLRDIKKRWETIEKE